MASPPRPPGWHAGRLPTSTSIGWKPACVTDNAASAAVLRRIGFRQTGERTDEFLARGGEHPVWTFEATRDDIFGDAGRAQEDGTANRCCWWRPAR